MSARWALAVDEQRQLPIQEVCIEGHKLPSDTHVPFVPDTVQRQPLGVPTVGDLAIILSPKLQVPVAGLMVPNCEMIVPFDASF